VAFLSAGTSLLRYRRESVARQSPLSAWPPDFKLGATLDRNSAAAGLIRSPCARMHDSVYSMSLPFHRDKLWTALKSLSQHYSWAEFEPLIKDW